MLFGHANLKGFSVTSNSYHINDSKVKESIMPFLDLVSICQLQSDIVPQDTSA